MHSMLIRTYPLACLACWRCVEPVHCKTYLQTLLHYDYDNSIIQTTFTSTAGNRLQAMILLQEELLARAFLLLFLVVKRFCRAKRCMFQNVQLQLSDTWVRVSRTGLVFLSCLQGTMLIPLRNFISSDWCFSVRFHKWETNSTVLNHAISYGAILSVESGMHNCTVLHVLFFNFWYGKILRTRCRW